MPKMLKKDEVIEGKNAYMYAKLTRSDMEAYKEAARMISENVRENDRILEVAPGPGYTIIELAKIGKYSITGMDLSFESRALWGYLNEPDLMDRYIH